MSDMKPTTHRVYLNDEEAKLMKSICTRTELGHTELLGKIVTAGLKAVASNGDTFRLPLRFAIIGEAETARSYVLNEPKARK